MGRYVRVVSELKPLVLRMAGVSRLLNLTSRGAVCQSALFRTAARALGHRVTMSSDHGPVAQAILAKLTEQFKPVHLEIINESYMHNVPKGSETHFKVVVVSDMFQEAKPLARHRLVNSCLAQELQQGVQALSIMAQTPLQWGGGKEVDKSPACRGGFGK